MYNPSEISVKLTAGKVVAIAEPVYEDVEVNAINIGQLHMESDTCNNNTGDPDDIAFNIGDNLNQFKPPFYCFRLENLSNITA